jgi:MFS family permease
LEYDEPYDQPVFNVGLLPQGTILTQTDLPPYYRRNFCCLALDFCFFGIGMAFFGPSTVIPSYLSVLGASSAVIGLLSTLQRAGWLLPQLLAARYLADKAHKKPYILLPAGLSRSLILVLAVLTALLGARAPRLMIALAIVILGAFWVGDGLGSVAWFELLSKAIPPRRRGRLTGVGQVFSGTLSFAAGFAVEWVLSERGLPFPLNYAGLFLAGFVMLAISFTGIALTREPHGTSGQTVPTWRDFIPQLWQVLREDRDFRRYIITRQVFSLNLLAAPFYMTYALEVLDLPDQVAGRYTSIGVVGSVLAAVLFAWLNERHGTRRAIQVSTGVTLAIPLLALAIPALLDGGPWLAWAYGLVFLANNAAFSSYLPAWTAYVLETAPEAERPLYVGLNNSLNGIATLFSTLGGLILQWTDDNYNLLFLLTMVGPLLALPLTLRLSEPRGTAEGEGGERERG